MSRIDSKQPITAPLKKDAAAAPAIAPKSASTAPLATDQLTLQTVSRPQSVVIAEGDTLSSIAEKALGDPNRWEEIFEANRDRLRDPHRLMVGVELRMPGSTAPIAPAKPGVPCKDEQGKQEICPFVPGSPITGRQIEEALGQARKIVNEPDVTYTAKRGDSLSRIASRMLGDAGRWKEILDANPDILKTPEGLQPGMVLKLPDGAKEVLRPRADEPGEEPAMQGGQLWDMAREFGRKYNLDPRLIMAVVEKESNGNPRARSHVGARGLMQLMPGTARELGVTDPYNARQNMDAGSRYLKQMIREFGDVRLGLMAYNWGPGNVRSYVRGRKKPPAETRNYVPAVLAYYRQFGGRA
jgi:LysM repeat protein